MVAAPAVKLIAYNNFDFAGTLRAIEDIPDFRIELSFEDTQLDVTKRLSEYKITPGCTLDFKMAEEYGFRPRGKTWPRNRRDQRLGLAPGGRIAQKIIRDTLPLSAYDGTAARLTSLTGLPPPVSPVSAQTYLQHNFPWYELYEERVPHANNAPPTSALATVKSIATVDEGRTASGKSNTQAPCGYCVHEMATFVLGLTPTSCPSCTTAVTPMTMPGKEAGDGVAAGSKDERIIVLG
ncbi:hypothetical protein B0H21DRAFT_754941 [Amylocystis lapponica]|nr:hypothetical protein B0H21DRAFT_754941 [Amylocystis lapponica]